MRPDVHGLARAQRFRRVVLDNVTDKVLSHATQAGVVHRLIKEPAARRADRFCQPISMSVATEARAGRTLC